jgi:predicted nucleic acid-binding protein
MDIVVDTSVIIAVIADEPEKDVLIDLTRGVDLIAPPSVHWEVANAFSAMLRRKRTTLALALEAIDVYERIPIRFVEVELDQSLRLADALSIYAYDAYLIRCAQKYRSPLLTLDAYLLECARRTGVQLLEVSQ